jgi:heme oxygenase (biliverdin-producing, ferredoxin)
MSILRESTQQKHQAVEALPFVQYLLRGNISQTHYVMYLSEMHKIYDCLETLSTSAGLLDHLPELPRADRILQDLQELDSSYVSEPTDAVKQYLEYLNNLYLTQPDQLFAHVYVRHLGDMYGGKLIARSVPGTGRWYEFNNRADLIKRFNNQLHMGLAQEADVAFNHFLNIFQDLWIRIHN